MRVIIIGCGPAGGYTGYLLALQGHTVLIYEEHEVIGSPIQCTGILTKDILRFFPDLMASGTVVNTIDHITINSPGGERVIVGTQEYIVCRTKFDQMIAERARQAGATIRTNCLFVEVKDNVLVFKDKTTGELFNDTAEIIIGADGPRSKIAKHFFPKNMIPSYSGMQVVVTKPAKDIRPHTYDTYFGDDFPCFFGWDVPESPTATRLGLAVHKNVSQHYDKFCSKVGVTKDDFGERQGGQIPVFNPKNQWHAVAGSAHVFLVGDAATQIKSTTGGGIIPHLHCATFLASCIATQSYARYRITLSNPVSRELYMHLFVRLVLDTFSNKDYDRLVRWCAKPQLRCALASYSRDNATLLFPKIMLAQPRLLWFAKNGIAAIPGLFKALF